MASVIAGSQDNHESAVASCLQRDDRYWFPTGDIVLAANNKVAYKISTGPLFWKSTVFRDLVNRDVPQPPEQEMMDDCPVIHLTDEPEDLKIFLNLIYDGRRFQKENGIRKWPVVKVMIMLGSKYDVSELYDEGVEIFNLTFPRNVADITGPEERIDFTDEDIISAANLTEALDPDLHAIALYLCCTLPIDISASGLLNKRSGLSAMAAFRCLIGRENLARLVLSNLNSCVNPRDIYYHPLCRNAMSGLQADISTQSPSFLDPRVAAIEMRDQTYWRSLLPKIDQANLCSKCKAKSKETHFKVTQDFRDGLKERFGLLQEPTGDERIPTLQ